MTENMEQAHQTLPNGTIISGYRIERELGRGAMSVVYLAQQLDLQRPVALKILAAELAADKEFVKRFFNEARAAASLSHPHIIQAYDAGVAEGDIYFFCMEFVEGETLLALLEREHRLAIDRSLQVAREIASALNYGFQRAKFTHGDIKPDNIILNQLGQAKLADFGLAKVEGHDFDGSEIMLTPLYAPPELIRGERRSGDCRSDIYAFGATIYHLIAGSPPFPGTVASEVLDRHMHENPEPLRLRYHKTPLGLSDFISRMLSKDPGQRPQNWEEVLYNLRQCQQYLAHTSGGATPAKQKKPLFIKPAGSDSAVGTPPVSANSNSVGINSRARRQARANLPIVTALIFACLLLLACLSALILLRRPSTSSTASSPAPAAASPSSSAVSINSTPAADSASPTTSAFDFNGNKGNATPPSDETTLSEETAAAADESLPADLLPKPDRQDNHQEEERSDQKADQPEQITQEEAANDETAAATAIAPAAPQFSLRLPLIEIPLSLLPEQLSQETWIEAAQCLAHLSYDLSQPTPAEAMMRGVKEWLQHHNDDNDATSFMQFIHDLALPALEELNVKIVQKKDVLQGQMFRNRRRETVSIANITFTGLEVDKVLADGKGKYRQRLNWEQAKNEGLLEELGRKVFPPQKSNLAQMRPFLAYLAFTGRSQEIPRLLQQLQQRDISPEHRHWAMLPKIETWANKAEADALRLWRRLQKACKNGNAPLAYETATRLRRGNTVTAGLYSRQLEDVIRQGGPQMPPQQAGELLRQAQAAMQQNNHLDALDKLLLAQARYGQVEYPEKSGLETRLETVLDGLPISEWLETENPRLVYWLPFFLPRPRASWPAWAFIAEREAAAPGRLPQHKESAEQIADWAQLELGNWNHVWNKLGKKQPELLLPSETAARMTALFGTGILLERLGNDEQKVEQVLTQLFSEATSDRGASRLEKLSLAYRYALLTRQCHLLTSSELARQRLDFSAGISPAASLLASSFVIAMLEAGDTALAFSALTDISSISENLFPKLSLSTFSEGASFSGISFSPAYFPAQASVSHLRLLLSLSDPTSFSASSDQSFQELVAVSCSGWPLDGGELIFSWLLRRCGDLVAVGDLASACALVDWCLSLTGSCLYPYYSRLHFLKSGLYVLCGYAGALETAAVYINAATVASDTERRFLQSSSRADSLTSFLSRLPSSHPGQFWFRWLSWCLDFSSAAESASLASSFSSWSQHGRTISECHFQSSVASYARHLQAVNLDELNKAEE